MHPASCINGLGVYASFAIWVARSCPTWSRSAHATTHVTLSPRESHGALRCVAGKRLLHDTVDCSVQILDLAQCVLKLFARSHGGVHIT